MLQHSARWVGSSKRDFLEFPLAVKDELGNALGIAQFGGTAPTAKPWKGLGAGVQEIVESYEGKAYRVVYTVELVVDRLKTAQRDYEDHDSKPKR